jgi:hypothetical protein
MSHIIKDGLVFYVDAANPISYVSGNTTCVDLISIIGGTLEGGIGFSTENKGVWEFDGSDDYIDFGNHTEFRPEYNEPFSCMLWIKRDRTAATDYLMSSFKHSSGANRGWQLYFIDQGPGPFRFQLQDNTGEAIIVKDPVGINDTTQFHCIGTSYDGSVSASGVTIFRDGTFPSMVTDSDNLGTDMIPTHPFRIGCPSNIVTSTFMGKIGMVLLYRKELSPEEFTQNYNSLKGRYL